MNCDEIECLIDEFHDGELNYDLESRIRSHIPVCTSCRNYLDSLDRLDRLFERSSVTPPSIALDRKIMQAIEHQQNQRSKPDAWWRKTFFGSVSISKPILAAALILMIFAVIGAHLAGRNASRQDNFLTTSSPTVSSNSFGNVEQPKTVEPPQIKIVEVPVIKKSIVERVVYVDRYTSNRHSRITQNTFNQTDFLKDNSLAKNKYGGTVSLKGFQPLPEIKTEIIKAGGTDEK